MKRLRTIVIISLVYLVGVASSPLWIGMLHAFGETTGVWTAAEKRQVIQLLDRIESNTQIRMK